ncbi:hypothetical protein LBMAG21_03600 [Armatimonadota bacterium]|nr:hypothetical protein LBMAG21_03600 [Armatimonadota bacterium]
MMSQVVIEVRRGALENIYSNANEVEIVIVDRESGEAVLQAHRIAPSCLSELPSELREALNSGMQASCREAVAV